MDEKAQMTRLYQEGGFQDDGAEIESVTGNEVPEGSLDQEVRDDIDAKLSEGEYVLPADVVRFIGLGQIESLVQQAKQGLAQMESNGRIGGETVDQNGIPVEDDDDDDELSPEEEQMLAEALGESPTGMAQGGAVTRLKQAQAGGTPYNLNSMKTYYNPETGELRSFPDGEEPPEGFEETTSATEKPEVPQFRLKGDRQGAGGPIGTAPADKNTPGFMGDVASVVGPAVDATIGNVAEKTADAVSSMAEAFSGREEANMSAAEVADEASKDSESESKDSGSESESSGSDSGDSGESGGEGGEGGPEGEGGGESYRKGGLVSRNKRKPNKRKKPYKNKRSGLGSK